MNLIDELIEKIPNSFLSADASNINAVILLDLTGKYPGKYHINVENGRPSVEKGGITDPDLSLSCSSDDLILLSRGELDPGKAFMTGRLGISGDITIALKLLGQLKK